jgi:4-amino-4-deoxy-L-arabinose transferase-like glycosyltransferase
MRHEKALLSISDNQVRVAPRARAATLLHPLLLVLLLGLGLRLALWGQLPRTGLVSDEGEYLSAATWLAQGRGFAWYLGYLWTRAPLYPLFVAAHLRLVEIPEAIVVTQTALSLLNVALVYELARRVLPRDQAAAPLVAAALMALYLPFAIYPQMLLSETLFVTLLLAGFLALAQVRSGTTASEDTETRDRAVHAVAKESWRRAETVWPLVLAGVLFGLAALTRSLALGFIPIVALWIVGFGVWQRGRRQFFRALLFVAAAGAVVLPWTIYNSRVFGGPIVMDTSGAFNALLGARTAFDGRREDAQVRDFVLGLLDQTPASDPAADACTPFPGPLPNQAARQAAMTREASCLIAARPAAFVQKSLAELIDLFQINYTGAERFTSGFTTGRLPRWYALATFVLDDLLYVLVLPLGVLGWAHARRNYELGVRNYEQGAVPQPLLIHNSYLIILITLWWLYNLAAAPLLFAINRFRLPLLPFVFIFAGYALVYLFDKIVWRFTGLGRKMWGGNPHAPLRSHCGQKQLLWYALNATLALLLWLVAATPHAYFEPLAPGQPSRWASLLGPYPSSLVITGIALEARPRGEGDAGFAAAVQADELEQAAMIMHTGPVSDQTTRLGPAILALRAGRPDETLRLLPPPEQITASGDAYAAVLRGDALRTLGDHDGARAAMTPRFVDDANPVAWAWQWLRPAPADRIDLGGNLDLGYIDGCYLGEGDPLERATYRWCSDGAQLRFPAAGAGAQQQLTIRADGRGWAGQVDQAPLVRVLVGGQEVGSFTPDLAGPREYSITLPPAPVGTDVVVTLRSATFVPGPERFLRQQSERSLGQVQRLAVRLDWAELTER